MFSGVAAQPVYAGVICVVLHDMKPSAVPGWGLYCACKVLVPWFRDVSIMYAGC